MSCLLRTLFMVSLSKPPLSNAHNYRTFFFLVNKKGTHSWYTRWRGLEIMFHVSTCLPFASWDQHKLQISRVIGNDITNIIFIEGTQPYNPDALISAVTHVFGVVQPIVGADSTRYDLFVWLA
jgi:hypothetical protein